MRIEEISTIVDTKLLKIAEISKNNRKETFDNLIRFVNKDTLRKCFEEVDGKKAKGIDKVSKEEYGLQLEQNLEELITRMKAMQYRPQPVKRVNIPKGDGKTRPLGISTFEDKLVQMQIHKILEAIYEPIFLSCSYGFRPKKSCHNAVEDLYQYLDKNKVEIIIDVDLEGYFNTIDHKTLVMFLEHKIKDLTLIRYIVRMLKAGIMEKENFSISDEGVPQGSICSPILANIFAHYVIDLWVTITLPKEILGKVKMFRYADDMVICLEKKEDAEVVKTLLDERLTKFGLRMNKEKTKDVSFNKRDERSGTKQEMFDFLGFTFYLGRTRKGIVIPKVRTKKKSFKNKLQNAKQWIIEVKDKLKLKAIWEIYISKIRGHIQYYGVSFNFDMVDKFVQEANKVMFKYLNRRSQRKSFNWEQFTLFMKAHPLPKIQIKHRLF